MNNRPDDDGRVLIAMLTERQSSSGRTYYLSRGFGFAKLLMIGTALKDEKGHPMWRLYAVPQGKPGTND